MQIVMVVTTRYDDEILPDFIEYHLAQGVDRFCVLAHLASDRAFETLDDYREKGVLNYRAYYNDIIPVGMTTELCREVSEKLLKLDPDSWVIPMDADCFWWPKEGTVRETLERISGEYNAIQVPQQSFVPNLDESGKWYERMAYRDRYPHTLLKHPMPPREAFKATTEAAVAPGHHSVDFPGKNLFKPDIECFHYSHVSYEQFMLKIAIKGPLCETNPKWLGSDYRMLRIWYNRYKTGDLRQIYESISYPVYKNVIVDRRMERWFYKFKG